MQSPYIEYCPNVDYNINTTFLGWADNDQIYVATLGRYVILRRNLDNTPVDIELPSGFLLEDIVQLLGKLSDEELLHFLKDLQKLTKYR